MPKRKTTLLISTFSTLLLTSNIDAAEISKVEKILEKSVYSPGELLNQTFTVTAKTSHEIEIIRDESGKTFQKIDMRSDTGKPLMYMTSFYCVNVNAEPVKTNSTYTFEAAHHETQSFRPPTGVHGIQKHSIFICENFRSPSLQQPTTQHSQNIAPTSASPAEEPSSEGVYTNEKITITLEYGPRGGTEITSSMCKDKVFRPAYDGEAGMYQDPDGHYAINLGENYIHIDIESDEKCLPEGRYKKI